MTWETRFAECDSAVREWMETQGWPVTEETHHEFRDVTYAWRHEGADQSYTLWITKIVIEDTEPLVLVELLNSWKVAEDVAEKLREQPDAHTWVRRGRYGGVVVEQLPGPPE